ncbi:hypothetical protein GWK08_08880 [Leptobacterium flavescens]|uniref:Uncharacterized protein n=1 Tax=Leptobacterium flavescens TaxID=472055 RepID=A0A6P0UNR3_9FLAO|nr:hypothetical protein [Leptobacterium flavescens]NER13548.1 hypothetical protein [Leptobacterium flavescens]
MISDIKNSINKVINERLVSPFYGAYIFSWSVWNWKIIYLTIFVSEDKIHGDKITYISDNFLNWCDILLYPFLSTIALVTLIPFLANGAYWAALKFNKWKVDKRSEIQKLQQLTVEQSMELRESMRSMEEGYQKLIDNKDLRIKQLELLVDSGTNDDDGDDKDSTKGLITKMSFMDQDEDLIVQTILRDSSLLRTFDILSEISVSKVDIVKYNVDDKKVNYFIINDIFEQPNNSFYFSLTEFGKKISRRIYRERQR